MGGKSWAGRVGREELGGMSWAGRVGREELGGKSWAGRVGRDELGGKSWVGRITISVFSGNVVKGGSKIYRPENEGGNYVNSANRRIHKISPPILEIRYANRFFFHHLTHLYTNTQFSSYDS